MLQVAPSLPSSAPCLVLGATLGGAAVVVVMMTRPLVSPGAQVSHFGRWISDSPASLAASTVAARSVSGLGGRPHMSRNSGTLCMQFASPCRHGQMPPRRQTTRADTQAGAHICMRRLERSVSDAFYTRANIASSSSHTCTRGRLTVGKCGHARLAARMELHVGLDVTDRLAAVARHCSQRARVRRQEGSRKE